MNAIDGFRMEKIEVNEEEYKPLWEVLGNYNLAIHIPSQTTFKNSVLERFPNFNIDVAVAWYRQVVG